MSIQAAWEHKGGVSIAQISGRIDGANASGFQGVLEAGFKIETRILILDFEQVAYISSAGLRVILSFARQLGKQGVKFALCSMSRPVYDVFSASGFDQIISVHASPVEAIRDMDHGDDPQPDEAASSSAKSENSFDRDVVANNMPDIVALAIEKYEHKNDCTLPDKAREQAKQTIEKALWRQAEALEERRRRAPYAAEVSLYAALTAEELQERRQRIIRQLHALAETALEEALVAAD